MVAIFFGALLLVYVAMFQKTSPLIFMVSVSVLYFISRPSYLLSPENLIFLYYFTWYGVAPLVAERFSGYGFDSLAEINAYNMLYVVYVFSLLVLLWVRGFFVFKFHGFSARKKSNFDLVVVSLIMVVSLCGYIMATGGWQVWLTDAKMAFISREGAGIFYLLYTHALMVFAILLSYKMYSRGSGMAGVLVLVAFVVLMYPFIGSKLKVIMIVALALAPFIIRSKLYSRVSFFSCAGGLFLVLLGLYLRNSSWMTIHDVVPYFFNYFNTLEMFVVMLSDFSPGMFESAFLPINKILMVFGDFWKVPYPDMSMWLTSIYYPDAAEVGATEQWPIEADFYLSFGFWGGLPFLFIYLLWLSYLHQGARTGNLAFCLIYILEFFFIVSHYRGGIFLWWYYYLLPFYICVFLFFHKYNFFGGSLRELSSEGRGE